MFPGIAMCVFFCVSTAEDPMNSMTPKEGIAMKDGKGKVEITLDEAEKVTGGSFAGYPIHACPKCDARFCSVPELEEHLKTVHNISSWEQVYP